MSIVFAAQFSSVMASDLTERKKKVLFIIDGMNVGGSQEFILNYCRELPEFEITIISLFGDNAYAEALSQLRNVNVKHLCKARGTNRKKLVFFIPYILIRFALLARSLPSTYDWINPRLPFAALLCWLFGVSRQAHCHFNIDCDARQLTFYEKAVFRLCLPSFGSLSIPKSVRSSYSFLPLSRLSIGEDPYFVTRRFSDNPVVYRVEYNLLFVARLVPQKGLRAAIDIAAQLESMLPGRVQLHIIGDGSERDGAEQHCVSNDITNVIFHGHRLDLADYMINADGIIKTAIGEPANSVVRESLLIGKRVFATIESASDRVMADSGLIIAIDRALPTAAAQIVLSVLIADRKDLSYSSALATEADKLIAGSSAREYYIGLVSD